MGKTVQLRTGSTRVGLTLPDGTPILATREPPATVSKTAFAADLDEALARFSLAGYRVAVVLADKTRLCDYGRYLPVLVERLDAHGADPAGIVFYIAYGTHPVQNDTESNTAYGEVFSRCRFVHHDCADDTLFQDLGTTIRGTPIRLRKDILQSDVIITFGAISHHYFAGYGGGRKLIFPGLGSREAIYRNHGLFLDPKHRMLSPGCRSGHLEGNPLADDLAEIERRRPADLAIHGILDSRGRVRGLMVGSGPDHFRQACEYHAQHCEADAGDGFDMVVASCGGYPKDINFIQAHKAVHHAAAFVNDGGTLVVFAQCHDQIGSATFLPWFDLGWDAAFDRLRQRYEGNGGTALAMMQKTRRIRIGLVTALDADLCRTIGVVRLDEKSAADMTRQQRGSLAVIPNASLLVRRRDSGA